MSEEKKGFYAPKTTEKADGDCPSCVYKPAKEAAPEECPSCVYKPGEKKD